MRSKERINVSSSNHKKKGLVDHETFRISKINLNSYSDIKLTQPRLRKSLLLDPTPAIEKIQIKMGETKMKRSISNAFQRIKPDLNKTIE